MADEITRYLEQPRVICLSQELLFSGITPGGERLTITVPGRHGLGGTAPCRTVARLASSARSPPALEEGRTEHQDARSTACANHAA